MLQLDPSKLSKSNVDVAPKPRRLDWVEPAKAIGIILVIAYHSTGLTGWPNYSQGQIGVDVFLILSGMGLTLNLRQENWIAFFRRRLETIAPFFWLVLVAFVILDRTVLGIRYRPIEVWSHFTMLHATDDRTIFALDTAWWFIGAIFLLYIGYFLLRPLITGGHVNGVIAASLTVSLLVELYIQYFGVLAPGSSPIYTHFAARIVSFGLGIALGMIMRGNADFKAYSSHAAVAMIAFLAYHAAVGMGNLYTVLLGVFYFSFSYLISVSLTGHLYGALNWIGVYSYQIYLIHDPILTRYNRAIFAPFLVSHSGLDSSTALKWGAAFAVALTVPLAWMLGQIPVSRFLTRANDLFPGAGLAIMFLGGAALLFFFM